jgi:GTPase SAR1 family protein
MIGYQEFKKEVFQINQSIFALLQRMMILPGTTQRAFDEWLNTCRGIDSQLSEEMVRIAVIGAIKSGKSTLINSFFSGDYLRRGAGVVTAMVTKIRRGNRLKATLFFKSWDEINADIDHAMVLLPSVKIQSRHEKFDLRKEEDRQELQAALGSMERKQLISNDTRSLNSLYLSYYARGYERVKDFLASEAVSLEYYDNDFSAHREFSGNEVMALYLKDISLEIDTGEIDENIEIADCQGSDSPNPLHMAMIQDYLIAANLLIYVISSRTGIRQADINFLSMIRKMGLIDHILFVVNIDFNEHSSVDDLKQLIEKVKEDLSLVKPGPEVYAYSALLSLFRKQKENLNPRERDRMAQWERESEMAVFSEKQESAFISKFQNVVTLQRRSLLLNNHLDRLKMIESGLRQWIAMKLEVLVRGVDEVSLLLNKVKAQQKKVDRLKSLVKSTLDGALVEIKRNARGDVDRFFDRRSGEVVPQLIEFVNNYGISFHKYQDNLSSSGFADTLYLVFQEFTHAINSFMAENVNPRIFKFIKDQEEKIKEYFDSISGPYESMARDVLAEYHTVMTDLGIGLPMTFHNRAIQIDFNILKKEKGLKLPPAAVMMNYSAAIKTEAMVRLGVYNFLTKIRQWIKKPAADRVGNSLAALKDAVSRMKKETVSSLIFHFKNYNENIKFQYIFKFIDLVSDQIFALMMERFHDYSQDLKGVTNATATQQVDREQLAASLREVQSELNAVTERIRKFENQMSSAAAQTGF